MINVFIVDDHQIFRDGLRLLIETSDDMMVVGEAASGASVMPQLVQIKPDLILMDIQMPGENGIEVTRRVKQAYPEINVLMVTMFEDDRSVFAAMQAGAIGYVLKGINHAEMLQTIRIAAGGGAVFSPSIASHMMQWFKQMSGNAQPTQPTQPAVSLPDLTEREYEVLTMLAAGDNNAKIAEKLFVTPKTVRNYVSQVLKKLAVDDRHAAASKAQQAGLGR
ncbi:MAG: response regulator transcription factor [Anaerolineae bacterium]|nr:response regulator transcription factor [Anaerolineae bacterium]